MGRANNVVDISETCIERLNGQYQGSTDHRRTGEREHKIREQRGCDGCVGNDRNSVHACAQLLIAEEIFK